MLFRSLLTKSPDWQSADVEERIAAAAALAADSPELVRLFTADPETAVRAAAAARLTRLSDLRGHFDSETDPAVRRAMGERAAALLAGSAVEAPALEVRLAALDLGWEPAVLEATVLAAGDASMQLAAIETIRDDAVLARIADSTISAEVRAAAIDRVAAADTLAEIARSLRGHDKSLWRRAQTRLDGMRDDARRQEHAVGLIAEAQALAASEAPASNQLAALDRAWQELRYEGEGAATFHAAVDRVRTRLEARAASQVAASRLLAAANDLNSTLPADGSDPAAVARAVADLKALDSQWSVLPVAALPRSVVEQFAERRRELAGRIGVLDVDAEALRQREALLTRLGAAVAVHDDQTTRALLGAWEQLPVPRRSPAQAAQDARLQSLRVRRNAAAPVAQSAPATAAAAIEPMLVDFEKAIADGEFGKARPLDAAIAEARAAAPALPRSLARRIDAARHAFEGLASWQRWGSTQAHERLCQEAEALLEKPLPPAELARSVRDLRERWKTLDRNEGAGPTALWHRFDKLCTRAYEPARKHFAEQVRQRRENAAARETFLAEVAAQVEALPPATAPGTSLPAKDLQRQIEAWQRRWRALGPVDRPKWKGLDARFAAAVEPVKRQVDEAVAASKARRKQLVEAAQALGARPMREAVGEVKSLQAAWRETAAAVMLPRGEEKRLWEAFRAACDAVFQRRDAESKSLAAKREAAAAARSALLDELEQALAAFTGATSGPLAQVVSALDNKWRAAGPADRESEKRLAERRAGLEEAARARLAVARRSRHFAVFEALAARARLCEEAEALASGSGDAADGVATLREQWSAAPPVPPALEAAALERFERAASGRAPEASAADARGELLLRAEILSGLDSPPEEARERMSLRVEYLNRSVSGDAPNELAEMQGIAARWAGLPGQPTAAQRARWDRALRTFQARSSTRLARRPSGD